MKKKIILSLLVIVALFGIVGCKGNNKVYTCKNKDNSDGKRYLTAYSIELNSKNEAVKYSLKDGFGNYGDNKDGFNSYCDGLKSAYDKNKSTIEKYKDAVNMEVVCDDKKMEAYYTISYNLDVTKDIEDYKKINEEVAKYNKDDGTFDLEAWKNYFNTDSLKAGNYTCDF